MDMLYPTADEVDITLILEGTYPFVAGGVSSWTHHLIKMLPQYRFGVIFLGGQHKDYHGLRYELPPNLVHLEAHYLFEYGGLLSPPAQAKIESKKFDGLCKIHDTFVRPTQTDFFSLGKKINDELVNTRSVTLVQFLHSMKAWQYIVSQYKKRCPDISFLNYFWTVRNMHMPMWRILDIAQTKLRSRMFHSISTGYAGLLGALLHHAQGNPFVLTEHGLYVKERKIDLLQSQWEAVDKFNEKRSAMTHAYLTDLWIKFFEILAHFAYACADPIISLFKGYQQVQIASGAPEKKAIIVPNGVPIWKDEAINKSAPQQNTPIIAFIGRVVPIKDIKTFVRSMVSITTHIQNAKAWIVGPMDEDKRYVHECRELVNVLNLDKHIIFKGTQKLEDILPQVDLVVLSSISEGLPLVVLEAFSAGVPVVSTHVGACQELVYGNCKEDEALGAAGEIVAIADSNALAQAIVRLLTTPDLWRHCQEAGRKRAKAYYSEEKFIQNYTSIYEKAMGIWLE